MNSQPFEVNENVLVESKSGKLLWDAKVLKVSRTEDDSVNGYRVRYTGWSSRFDEWVEADRLVEPSDNNRQVQVSLQQIQFNWKIKTPLFLFTENLQFCSAV